MRRSGDWFRFLHERHLLILDWVEEGKSFEEISGIFSMDPLQVQLISMTPAESLLLPIPFGLGVIVEWTSSSAGTTKTKRGEIVQVVHKWTKPDFARFPSLIGAGTRDHESYVIKVGSTLYYPRVSALRSVQV